MSWWTITATCSLPPRIPRQGRQPMPNEARGAAPAVALALSLLMNCALSAASPGPSPGESLYRRGQLLSGEPVQALRQGGATVRGADAACVNCHRRSGLGSSEGKITIPPVAGPYLFTPRGKRLERRGVLAVMNQYFVDKNNAAARTKAPTLYSSHATMFRVERRWQLHVWELTGAPRTWETQLRAHLAAEPVFAVISGLGGSDWGPV